MAAADCSRVDTIFTIGRARARTPAMTVNELEIDPEKAVYALFIEGFHHCSECCLDSWPGYR